MTTATDIDFKHGLCSIIFSLNSSKLSSTWSVSEIVFLFTMVSQFETNRLRKTVTSER